MMRLLEFLWGRPRPSRPQPPGVEPLESRTLLDAAANDLFVQQAYQDLLFRPADPTGLDLYSTALDQNRLNRIQVALALMSSPEFRAAQVAGAFNYYLMRAPDPVGLGAFTQELVSGGTLEEVEAALLGSQEYFE